MNTAIANIIDLKSVDASSHWLYLGELEANRLKARQNPMSLKQGLGSRLMAKHLILNRFFDKAQPADSDLEFQWFQAENLDRSSEIDYRKIEIIESNSPNSSGPKAYWNGFDLSNRVNVSLSHSGDIAAAFLCSEEQSAIDVEVIEPRHEAFYKAYFNAAERDWILDTVTKTGEPADRYFTLLWSLKECILKAHRSDSINFTDISGITIDELPKKTGIINKYNELAGKADNYETFTFRSKDVSYRGVSFLMDPFLVTAIFK